MNLINLKGIEGLYEYCCDNSFYEWVFPIQGSPPSEITERCICNAPVWYNDSESLTLIESYYDSIDESNSTWKLSNFSSGKSEKRLPHRPYKLFQLESDDDLVVVKCKIRPVLLIKKIISDWTHPNNTARMFNTWLCLPIFSYKPRHSQKYVITDQELKRQHHFYFPPGTPGLDHESVGKLIELQFIPERNLTPFKKMCEIGNINMNRPVCLSEKAFHAVLGHTVGFFPSIEISGESKEWYDFFVELAREQIHKIAPNV